MSKVLSEGALQGHMNHLYDNRDLSFSKIKEILTAAADGKLEGTEKTDGQNLMISFSVKQGRAKGVRNKGEVKSGGLTPAQLAKKFADRENPYLKETFTEALSAFERTIKSLDKDTKIYFFGTDTNIYYNAEVMDPRTPNVFNYDTKALVIHEVGHSIYDLATGQEKDEDLTDRANKLRTIIQKSQERLERDKYGVKINAVKKLNALSDKEPLNVALNDIDSLLETTNSLISISSLDLDESSTINKFLLARVYILLSAILSEGKKKISPSLKINISKYLLGIEGLSLKDLKKNILKNDLEFFTENVLNKTARKDIIDNAIAPLELIISDFAVEILRSLQSAYILDPSKELNRIRSEVNTAISAIESSGVEEAMSILKKQMTKLRSVDKINTTAEGFVFDYDGMTYKFTGNFAPINQILGLFKYGRKGIPPLKKLDEAKIKALQTIAVVPGAFKPPHKGHLGMIKTYAKMADKVVIMMSPLARDLPNGKPVTFDLAERLWELYLEAEGLDNKVTVFNSPFSSPVKAAFEFVANQENIPEFAQPGQMIILGVSTKGGDQERFERNVRNYARPGVSVEAKPVNPVGNLSATDMRAAIASGDVEALQKFLPDKVKNKKEFASQVLNMFNATKQNKVSESFVYDIINETITKRGGKYCLLSKKTKKNLGCYKSKRGAKKREKQVQYFKHLKSEEGVGGGSLVGYGVPLGAKPRKTEQK